MVRPVTAQRLGASAGTLNATVQSTNWSGYAATGGNGAFTSISASWTVPVATCPSSAASFPRSGPAWTGRRPR